MSLRDILKRNDCTGCLVEKLNREIKKLKKEITDLKAKEAEENKKLEGKISEISTKGDKFIQKVSVENNKIIFTYTDGDKQELPLNKLEEKEEGRNEVWQ